MSDAASGDVARTESGGLLRFRTAEVDGRRTLVPVRPADEPGFPVAGGPATPPTAPAAEPLRACRAQTPPRAGAAVAAAQEPLSGASLSPVTPPIVASDAASSGFEAVELPPAAHADPVPAPAAPAPAYLAAVRSHLYGQRSSHPHRLGLGHAARFVSKGIQRAWEGLLWKETEPDGGPRQASAALLASALDTPTPSPTTTPRQDSGFVMVPEATEKPDSGLSGSMLQPQLPAPNTRRDWQPVTLDDFRSVQDELTGAMKQADWERLREQCFRGGADKSVRREVWRLLLGYYQPSDTYADRARRRAELEAEYAAVCAAAEMEESLVEGADAEKLAGRQLLFAQSLAILKKDVRRTDRDDPIFADEQGPGQKALRRVLVAQSLRQTELGYCQGMSDLAAVLYRVFEECEVECFHCFGAMLARGAGAVFERPEIAGDNLARFLAVVDPDTAVRITDKDPSYFCAFRWLIVLFKREFSPPCVLRLWDSVLSCSKTKQYHVVFAAALLQATAPQMEVLEYDQLLRFTQTLGRSIDFLDALRHAEILFDSLVTDGGERLLAALPDVEDQ